MIDRFSNTNNIYNDNRCFGWQCFWFSINKRLISHDRRPQIIMVSKGVRFVDWKCNWIFRRYNWFAAHFPKVATADAFSSFIFCGFFSGFLLCIFIFCAASNNTLGIVRFPRQRAEKTKAKVWVKWTRRVQNNFFIEIRRGEAKPVGDRPWCDEVGQQLRWKLSIWEP